MALNIKRAIGKYGLQARDVAARMGITPNTLSTHINGNPTVGILSRIAEAIGCDIAELFDTPETESGNQVCPHCGKSIKIHIGK